MLEHEFRGDLGNIELYRNKYQKLTLNKEQKSKNLWFSAKVVRRQLQDFSRIDTNHNIVANDSKWLCFWFCFFLILVIN